MGYFAQQIVNGIHLGALYALLAFGYAIAHAVLRRASFVHGALFAFSGQVAIIFTGLGWHALWLVYPAALGLGVAAALTYTALAARMIAGTVLEPMRRAAPNTTIAASLGVMLVLMESVRIATGKQRAVALALPQPRHRAGARRLHRHHDADQARSRR